MTAAATFRAKAVERRADLITKLIEIEEGVDHSPEEIIDDALSIGLTIQQVAEASERLHKRHEAVQAIEAANWQKRFDDAMQAYRDANAAAELAKAAVTEAMDASRAAYQRAEAALALRSEIDRQRKEADKAYRELMKSTASSNAEDVYD